MFRWPLVFAVYDQTAFAFRWSIRSSSRMNGALQALERLKADPRRGTATLTGFFDLWAFSPDVVSRLWLSPPPSALCGHRIVGDSRLPAAGALGLY